MFDSSWPLDDKLKRPDVTYLGVPLAEMCNATFKGVRERILMKNIAYAGALAALIGMDTEIIPALTKEKYAAKKALLDSNEKAIALGYDYAKAALRLPAADPSREDGCDEGQHPDRRQHRGGARRRVCRRHRRRAGIRSRRRPR